MITFMLILWLIGSYESQYQESLASLEIASIPCRALDVKPCEYILCENTETKKVFKLTLDDIEDYRYVSRYDVSRPYSRGEDRPTYKWHLFFRKNDRDVLLPLNEHALIEETIAQWRRELKRSRKLDQKNDMDVNYDWRNVVKEFIQPMSKRYE